MAIQTNSMTDLGRSSRKNNKRLQYAHIQSVPSSQFAPILSKNHEVGALGMKAKIKIWSIMSVAVAIGLSGCLDETTEEAIEAAQNCADGDQTACDRLSEILAEYQDAIPEELTMASGFETESGYTQADKETRLENTFDPASVEQSLGNCLKALPPKPIVRSPLCYGPSMNYSNHPDGNDGNPAQLPHGDLGLWLDTEPGGNVPCAAEKMNELVTKGLHTLDMATGSMAMMICAAAHDGLTKPTSGELNLKPSLDKIPNSPFSITEAKMVKLEGNRIKTLFKASHKGSNFEFGKLEITVEHDEDSKSGSILIVRPSETGTGDTRATSARYRNNPDNEKELQIIMRSALFQNGNPVQLTADQQVVLGGVSGDPLGDKVSDSHFMVGYFNTSTKTQRLAYGWLAGGKDSHFRTFNADVKANEANAWYGYTPSPYTAQGTTTQLPDLDLSKSNAGMICNWTGPGHSHSVNNYLQHQYMTKSNGKWVLANESSDSKIRYVPVVSCQLTSNTNTTFTALAPDGSNADMSAHDITAGATYSLSATDSIELKQTPYMNVPTPSF